MRKFIITVDTEGDNLWSWKKGEEITTENALFIPRFQELCEAYSFVPTYLVNYEMAKDMRWVDYIKPKIQQKKCEVGMHIHAWNSPPQFDVVNNYGGNPYITEYPKEIMYEKVKYLKSILENQFETDILSNRSGRWATDISYFEILDDLGVKVDCSVTPQMDLSGIAGCSKNCGNDYSHHSTQPYMITNNLMEIPMTTRIVHKTSCGSVLHKLKVFLKGEASWLRPHKKSLTELFILTELVEREKNGYLEFMLHSSELIAGGSPYFNNDEDIEQLYSILMSYFKYISEKNYVGTSLSDYSRELRSYVK